MKSSSTASQTLDHLAERVRALVGNDPGITEKTMFGGLTFLLDGHILVGCKKDGRVLLSVGKEGNAEALARAGATQMHHNGRDMIGFVWVDGDAIEDDDDLEAWVRLARSWVSRIPPKASPSPRRAPSAKKPAPAAAIGRKAAPARKPPARARRTPD